MNTVAQIRGLFNRVLSFISRALRPRPQERPTEKRAAKRQQTQLVAEGGFVDLRSLLNGLDDTFGKLRRLSTRGSLPRALKKHGPFIFNLNVEDGSGDGWGLEVGSLAGFRAFGLPTMLFANVPKLSRHQTGDEWEHFSWALKCNNVPFIHRMPGFTYYDYGVWWPKSEDYPEFGIQSTVAVNKLSGEVIALPSLLARPIQINANGRRPFTINQPRWEYAPLRNRGADKKQEIVEDFCALYSLVMRREMGVNIIVKKDDARATFIVPENEWKRFFKERIDATSSSGRRVPVFHAVVGHERQLRDGRSTVVKTHYRGSRQFRWNGYDVLIVMPGLHGRAQAEFDIETYSEEPGVDLPQGMLVDAGDLDLEQLFGYERRGP